MGISQQAIEEKLSAAYAYAVISRAGEAFHIVPQDYGIDVSIRNIRQVNGGLVDFGPVLECQLKATIDYQMDDTSVAYDIEADAYNKLVAQRQGCIVPVILVLYCLPKDPTDWLDLTDENLILRKCCYWTYEFDKATDNARSKRIRIPLSQRFTPDSVKMLIESVKQGTFK